MPITAYRTKRGKIFAGSWGKVSPDRLLHRVDVFEPNLAAPTLEPPVLMQALTELCRMLLQSRPKDRRPPWRREQERAMGAGQPLCIPPPTISRAAFPVYVEFDDRPESEGSVDDANLPADTHTPSEQATDPQQTVDSEQSSQQSS